MAAEDKLFKLQQYQRTQQLIHDLNFEKAIKLPLAAGAEGSTISAPHSSSSYLLRRTQDSVSKQDMSLIRSHLKVMSEIDPANPYYSSLLERINHGERLSWSEFEKAIDRFSSQEYYLTKLQDEINNEKLAMSLEKEQSPIIEAAPEAVVPETTPTEAPEPPNNPESSHSEPSLPHSEAHTAESPHIAYSRPQALSKQGEEKLKVANKSIQQAQQKLTQPEPPVLSEKLNQRLNSANRVMRTRPTRITRINSRSMRKVPSLGPKLGAAAIAGGGGGGAAASGGALGNILGARTGLQIFKSTIGRLFPRLGSWAAKLMPEKLLAQGIRGLWNIGSSFGRAAFDGLIRNTFPRIGLSGFSSFGSSIGSWLSGAGTTLGTIAAGIGIGGWVFIGFIAAFIGFVIWDTYDSSSQCGQAGQPLITKSAIGGQIDTDGEMKFDINQEIEYKIRVVYELKCGANYDVEVKDTLPENTEYVEGSTKMPDVIKFQTQGTVSYEESREGNTLIWKMKGLPNRVPVELTFKVKPKQDDVWVINQASGKFATYQLGNGTVPAGGGEPPNQSNCNGTYKLGNPIGNFGDPSCNFTKDSLYAALQQQDPANADYWFFTVVKCESSYDPTIWANPIAVGTPDSEGAWGLFQMGRGKNGQYDHGDVAWQLQTSNAINYNNNLANKWRYWQCAKNRW